MLYQFLALIRTPDGRPLTDSRGRITSHLIGLLYRTTHLIIEHNIKTVFIFDGKPPQIKSRELEKRREERKKLKEQWMEAIERGDLRTAWSKAVRIWLKKETSGALLAKTTTHCFLEPHDLYEI